MTLTPRVNFTCFHVSCFVSTCRNSNVKKGNCIHIWKGKFLMWKCSFTCEISHLRKCFRSLECAYFIFLSWSPVSFTRGLFLNTIERFVFSRHRKIKSDVYWKEHKGVFSLGAKWIFRVMWLMSCWLSDFMALFRGKVCLSLSSKMIMTD